MSPTIVFLVVALMASRSASRSPALPERERASKATSNSAWMKPMGCVHCFFVAFVYAAARSRAEAPVSDDLKGWFGDHHTSVVSPSPTAPRASTERGKSSALPTVTAFGRKPCWRAWVQKVVKSGGISTPVTISDRIVYAAARSRAEAPVSDDLKGWFGDHHTSVVSPSPTAPRASTERGKSSALPTVTAFGRKPCWRAWVQKVVKSGGISTPVTI